MPLQSEACADATSAPFFRRRERAGAKTCGLPRPGLVWLRYDPATLASRLTRLDELLAEQGRTRTDIEVYVGPNKHPVNTETVAAYEAEGVQQLNVGVGGRDLDGFKRRAEKMAGICGL